MQTLLPACESLLQRMSGKRAGTSTFDEGLCLGIVVAAMQYGSTWFPENKKLCFQQNVSPGQAVADVVFSLKMRALQPDRAEVLRMSFTIAAASALFATYGCQRN
ncbi:MAG: hypothetical protein AAB403_03580 [Planctomycetota bacterium]